MLILIGILTVVTLKYGIPSDNIPTYCIDGICADKSVFSELPEYPSDFKAVVLGVEVNAYGLPENFSTRYPDENYYKQPGFYPDESFMKQGLKYYVNDGMRFSIGSGGYPSDILIQNIGNRDLININDTVRAVIYWHTGYAVWKYQPLKLVPEFPENMSMKMETYKLEQNPEEAERCLDVRISPENILLDPTYPNFKYNWAQKVEAYITIKCTGKFGMQISPQMADQWFYTDAIREYGIYNVSNSVSGGIWQIFIEVQ